ncbi:MAG: hypothetical protein NVS9B4_00090 [Candidatus Acidiferrum sp.]
MVNRDPKSVWNWLTDLGIPTRARGYASTKPFEKGQASAFLGHKHTDEEKQAARARRIADGHVPYLKDGVHHLKGKRGSETPNWKGGITPERQSFYASPEWVGCVKLVWSRDDAKCQLCGLDSRSVLRETVRFELHHVDSFAVVEQRANPDNVVLLCNPCHKWVHSRKNDKKLFIGRQQVTVI